MDLRTTARLHRRSLPDGFFARLGARFVRRYHAAFSDGPYGVVLVAEQDGQPVGFLAGTLANRPHYRWVLRQRGLRLALAGLLALVRRPGMGWEFLRTRVGRYVDAVRRQASGSHAPSGDRDDEPSTAPASSVAVLTHVAVATDARGDGMGRRLVEAFVERARRAGADEIRLITDADGAAARFYRQLGWRSRGRRRAADGTLAEEFELQLRGDAPSS